MDSAFFLFDNVVSLCNRFNNKSLRKFNKIYLGLATLQIKRCHSTLFKINAVALINGVDRYKLKTIR